MNCCADFNQRFFQKFSILILSWNVGSIILHITNLYYESLVITMRETFFVFCFFSFYLKLTEYFFTTFFQCP